ncbi:DUF423 domain-containing protein [Kriegella sp. EG-1]|nr:DUF423 domain-containing protein [Flavobacteriaceae bacterium EG-1]
MVLLAQFFGALYGFLAVIFGAFGAHALKNILSEEQLKNFQTGIKYQMYHSLLLLILSFNFNLDSAIERNMVYAIVVGTFLFSFSIYGLTLSAAKGIKMKFLGPITPVGGLLLVVGWGMLLYVIIKNLI